MKNYSFKELDIIIRKIAVFADVAIDNLSTHAYSEVDLFRILEKQFSEYPVIANRLVNIYETLKCDFFKERLHLKSMILAYMIDNSITDILSKRLIMSSADVLSETDIKFKISRILSRINKELESGEKGFFITSSKEYENLLYDYIDSIRATGNYCTEVKVGGASLLFVIPLRKVKLSRVSADLYLDRKAEYENPYDEIKIMQDAAEILVEAVHVGELSPNLYGGGKAYGIAKRILINYRNNRGAEFVSFIKKRDTLSGIVVSEDFFDVLKNSRHLVLAPYLTRVLRSY